jgi:putative endonuclease
MAGFLSRTGKNLTYISKPGLYGKKKQKGCLLLAHYVYLLRCRDGSIYTGYTVDVGRRLREHQAGKAAKYTRGRRPVELLGFLEFVSRGKALSWEAKIKKMSPKGKLKILERGVD